MKLIVITPEALDPREPTVLAAMFAAGLERCHVRKPAATRDELAAWLSAVPAQFRARIVLHQHHDLVAELALGGCHWRDESGTGVPPVIPEVGRVILNPPPRRLGPQEERRVKDNAPYQPFTSRSCHDFTTLRAALSRYDSVFFGPVFPSISKPGHGPRADFSPHKIATLLAARSVAERRTAVIALGGVTAENISHCRALGFDGVAVLGAVWQSADPVAVFRELQLIANAVSPSFAVERSVVDLRRATSESGVMCITLDGLPLSHAEQARQLCAAGARWVQLRTKNAAPAAWLATAREVVAICRAHGAICIINDSVEIAQAAEADGVHLGSLDVDWHEARKRLGPEKIIGGTVNNFSDAMRAREAGCLDYVGVGPLRFTATKQKLAPVLGLSGVSELLGTLGDLPAWVIGGIKPADLSSLRSAGASGVAISSALFHDGRIAENLNAFRDAWSAQPVLSS